MKYTLLFAGGKVVKKRRRQRKGKKVTKKRGKKYADMLVVCSCAEGRESINYRSENEDVKKMLPLSVDGYKSYHVSPRCKNPVGKFFPDNIPATKKYDVIWFAGCNGLANLAQQKVILDAEAIDNFLRPNGIFIMTGLATIIVCPI